uniref:RAB11 family interacting protein 4 (class II) b n=1 Tax=Nothobranchius furzeri TaxID=105023 RepID=A0A8C6LRU0_NOTFU
MCTRTSPGPDPESQSFTEEVGESEGGVADQGRERESDRDSAVESSLGSETSDGPSRLGDKEDGLGECPPASIFVTSDLSTRSSASLNEEQFEDYGEGEEPDYIASSPSPDDETRTNGCSDLGSSVPSSSKQRPEHLKVLSSGLFCSKSCDNVLKIQIWKDVMLKTSDVFVSLSRQLLHSSNLSSRNGSTEDLFRDSIDSCDTDINEKVWMCFCLCRMFVHVCHHLEKHGGPARTSMAEVRKYRHLYDSHKPSFRGRVFLPRSGASVSSSSHPQEKQRMTDKLEDTSLRLKDEMDLYKKMMEKLKQNRQQFQKEKDAMQELIEDLRRELEHLQLYKLEAEKPGRSRSSSSGLADFNSRTREVELEHEVKRLKQENQKLREQNEDLNGQILSLSLYEAKSLFATQTKAQSLAAEIDNASKDQLMEALKEQEEINLRLRQYMDKIILNILDHNPSILEIKN